MLQVELFKLRIAVMNLKKELKKALLRTLGVDVLVKRSFEEGWSMAHDTDPYRCSENTNHSRMEVEDIVTYTRCWRSVEEAWVNSDVEELV